MKLYILIIFLISTSCISDEVKKLPNTIGKLKINTTFKDINNVQLSGTDDIYLRVIENVTDNVYWSYYNDVAIFDDKLAVDNTEISLEAGSYDNLLVSSEKWSKDLTDIIPADIYIKEPFKIWKARKATATTVLADEIAVVDMTLEPQHSMIEFFLDPDVTMPEEVNRVEYVIKAWFMDFNTGMQSFTTKRWTTSDNSQYTDNNSTFITLNLTQDSGETLLPPFALYKDGEEDKGGITIRLFDINNKMIWQDGVYSNLNINWGEKYNVYYNPKIEPGTGTIRISMFSWNGLEEIDVYIDDKE